MERTERAGDIKTDAGNTAGTNAPGAPVQAANEDSPTGGYLYRLIARRPSRAIIYISFGLSAFYLGICGAYLWGRYSAQAFENIPLLDLAVAGAIIFLPVMTLWLVTFLIWQGQELKLMGEALARTAMRLTEPEDMASEKMTTLAGGVQREIDAMRLGLEEALDQAAALNSMISRQLEGLEAGTGRAEYRARAIEQVLERNRTSLEEIAHTLGSEADTISLAVRGQVESVRAISRKAEEELQEASSRLSGHTETLARAAEAASASAGSTSNMLDRQSSRLEVVAETALTKANELSDRYERQRGAVLESVNRLDEGRAELDKSFLAQRAQIEGMAQAMAAKTKEIDQTVADLSARIDKTANDLAGQIEGALHAAANRTKALGTTFASQVTTVINAAEEAATAVTRSTRDTTQAVSKAAEEAAATLTQATNAAAGRANEATAAMRQSASQLAQEATATLTQASDAAAEHTGKATQAMRQSANALAQDAAALGEEIEKSSTALHMDFDARNKDMRATLQSTANEIEKASEQLGGAMFRIGGAAKDAGRSLHSASTDLEKRMEELPGEAATGAKALREVLEEQVSALAAIAEIVVRHARVLDKTSPLPPAAPAQRAQPLAPPHAPPLAPRPPAPSKTDRHDTNPPPAPPRRWGISDLLAAAGQKEGAPEPEIVDMDPSETEREFHRTSLNVIETLQSLAIDLDRALEQSPPVELWHRYKSGERNVFTRRLYNLSGRDLFDQIAQKYRDEPEFRDNVDRFIALFEKLLVAASERDRDNILAETYLTSDTGKVYLMLGQASGHIS